MRRPTPGAWAKLSLVAAGLALGLLAAEGLLRLAGISFPLMYHPDPHVGALLRPGFRGWFSREGRAFVEVNRHGFRNRRTAIAKPAGTFRVAVLGDSFIEALQVPFEQTFAAVLERELTAGPILRRRRVEVLSFGISGHGTAQQLEMLRHHVWPYEPDVVVLAFFEGNDVRNNSRLLEPDHLRPFYVLEDERLKLDDSFLHDPEFLYAQSRRVAFKVALINRCRILQLVNELRSRGRRPSAGAGKQGGLDHRSFLEPRSREWIDAWEVTRRLIVTMEREVRGRGGRFLLVNIPVDRRVHPDARSAGWLDTEALGSVDRRLVAWGSEAGFPVLPLASALREYADASQSYLYGFENSGLGTGHWNALGHRIAAEATAEFLTGILEAEGEASQL